jgi:HSP20 family protein
MSQKWHFLPVKPYQAISGTAFVLYRQNRRIDMNFLKDRALLRELLMQGDLMNSVNGGVRQTDFQVETDGDDILINVSNPSVPPESFSFTVFNDKLLINVLCTKVDEQSGKTYAFPMFTKVVDIPFYIDIPRIDGTYGDGVFRIHLPSNPNIPRKPMNLRIRNLGDE